MNDGDRRIVEEIVREWEVERPDLDTSPMRIFGQLVRAYNAHEAALGDFLTEHGLTRAAFDVLANLRRTPPPHRKTPSELAASSLITTGGITFRLDRLENEGLVRRVPDPQDRRISYAELTDAGFELIDRIFPAHLEREAAILARLPATHRNALPKALAALEKAIAAGSAPDDDGDDEGDGDRPRPRPRRARKTTSTRR